MATDLTKKKKFLDNMVELAGDYDDKIHHEKDGPSDNKSPDKGDSSSGGGGKSSLTDEEYERIYERAYS